MRTILGFIAAGHLLAVLAIAQASEYTVTDLGVVGPNGQPLVITNNGLVAGTVANPSPYHAVVCYRGHEADISTGLAAAGFTGPNSQALSVNERAQVTGFAETSQTDPQGEDFVDLAIISSRCGFLILFSGTTLRIK